MRPADHPVGRRGSRAAAGFLLSLLATAALAAAGGGGDPFAECEARLAAQPAGWASLCFVRAARKDRRWAEARRRLDAHLKDRPADPYLHFGVGVLDLEGGRLPQAGEHFRAAAGAFAERGDPKGAALAWINLAQCRMRQGRLEQAGGVLHRADEAARAAADPGLQATVKVDQARLVRWQGGDLDRADQELREMERRLPADVGYQTWKQLLAERAALARRLGRPTEARRIDARSAALARQAGDAYGKATALSNVAVDAAGGPPRAGAHDEVIRLARTALDAALAADNRAAAITAHRLLGKLLGGEEGRAHLEECLRLATAADEPPQRAACLFALAGSLAGEDAERAHLDPERAPELVLDQALDLALASEDPWTVAYGWAERFRVSWATRSRSEAAADSLAVLDHIEALRRLQSSESGRAGFFTDWAGVYHSLAGFLLSAPDGPSRRELETAFSVAERLRARVLLDSLAAARVGSPPPPDAALSEQRTRVLREIVRIQRRLQDPHLEEDRRAGLLTELDDRERDLAALDDRPGAGAATALPERDFVGLSRVEAELAPNQAVLAYLLAPDEDVYGKFAGGSWLLAVTRDGTRAYRLPGRMELEIKVETFLGLIGNRDDGELERGAATLYDDLLGAALADIPASVDELVVVPDDVLYLLPFALLRPHPQADPLATRYRLSSVPSVTLWHRWRQNPEAASAAALALADPAFVGSGAAAAAPGDDPAAADRQWALETGGRLGRLPYAAEEGRSVVRRLGGAPSRLVVGEAASEAFLKRAPLESYGVLHLATHALVDDRRPRRSAVLLAAGGPDEDGLLQPREIAALPLSGKLVVISACDSGSGQVLLGEGVQSLARAFFRAGARTVVASLWRLEDEDAAAFFDLFYRSLVDGGSVAASVAAAQRRLRRRGAPAAAWAGVVVVGDGDLVPLPGGTRRSGWWWALLLPAAAAALWLLFRLRRRARVGPRPGPGPDSARIAPTRPDHERGET